MKIGVAQTKPVTGDILRNIQQHQVFIDLASSSGADILIFPELSLTGYEPMLAKGLAVAASDSRLDVFQQMSDTRRLIIGVGIPTLQGKGICISMIIFRPDRPRELYSKKYLHEDEEPFFISGQNASNRLGEVQDIALAICYEISVPEHAESASAGGATIYLTSVAKAFHNIDSALDRLSAIASNYSMMVLMANSVGPADGLECAGKSSVWDSKGVLAGQLDESSEGILILDTDTKEVIKKALQNK